MEVVMLKHIIDDIERAKNNKAYLSALALALTLPDICGNIEYLNPKVSFRYEKWYNTWVYKYFKQKESENEFIARASNATKFDGAFCYRLRCAMLHSGNTDLTVNDIKFDVVELSVCDEGEQRGYSIVCDVSYNKVKNIHVDLNVIHFIDTIIAGTNDYIEVKGDVSNVFGNIEIEVL